MSDISKFQALSLEFENKDPLPKNLENVSTMYHATAAVANLVNPIVCPQIQENCKNVNGHFSRMS